MIQTLYDFQPVMVLSNISSFLCLKLCVCFLFPRSFNTNSTVFLFFRSSLPKVFCKKGALRNFAKLTGKHLCQSLFFNKVAGLRPATLLRKRLWHRWFPVNFAKFLEQLCWLLLNIVSWLPGVVIRLKLAMAKQRIWD